MGAGGGHDNIELGHHEAQALNNYFSLPLGEPNKTSSFFVKSEPKQNYECYLPPQNQKLENGHGHGPAQNSQSRAQNTQNTQNNSVMFVTSASHFPQVTSADFLNVAYKQRCVGGKKKTHQS